MQTTGFLNPRRAMRIWWACFFKTKPRCVLLKKSLFKSSYSKLVHYENVELFCEKERAECKRSFDSEIIGELILLLD
jgi:hypothetical protein